MGLDPGALEFPTAQWSTWAGPQAPWRLKLKCHKLQSWEAPSPLGGDKDSASSSSLHPSDISPAVCMPGPPVTFTLPVRKCVEDAAPLAGRWVFRATAIYHNKGQGARRGAAPSKVHLWTDLHSVSFFSFIRSVWRADPSLRDTQRVAPAWLLAVDPAHVLFAEGASMLSSLAAVGDQG